MTYRASPVATFVVVFSVLPFGTIGVAALVFSTFTVVFFAILAVFGVELLGLHAIVTRAIKKRNFIPFSLTEYLRLVFESKVFRLLLFRDSIGGERMQLKLVLIQCDVARNLDLSFC